MGGAKAKAAAGNRLGVFFFFALANAVRADARAVLSNLDPQAHENFIASH
jgi:hypothetical protein